MNENKKDSDAASEIVRNSILIPFQEKLLFLDVQNQLTLDKWEQVKRHVHLSTGMTEVAYRTWIEPLEMKQVSGWAIDVYYPGDNELVAEYIMTHYRLAIQLAIHDVLGSDVYVEIKNKKATS